MSWEMTHEANLGKTEKLILISNRIKEDAITAGQDEFKRQDKFGLYWQLQYVWQTLLQARPVKPKPNLMEAAIEEGAKSLYRRRIDLGEVPGVRWDNASDADKYYCREYAKAVIEALL